MDKDISQTHQNQNGTSQSIPQSPQHPSTKNLLDSAQKCRKQDLIATDKSDNKFLTMIIDPPILKLPNKYTGCNCRKSECLKMYCVCFSSGRMCDRSCLCDSCCNKTDHMRRSQVINEIITRDPFAFSRGDMRKIEKTGDGCNCKKSNCVKKYCECFRRGMECGRNCRCIACANPIQAKVRKDKK